MYYVLSIAVNIGRDKKKGKILDRLLVICTLSEIDHTEIPVVLISAITGGVGFLLIIVIAAFCFKARRRRRRGKRASNVFQQAFI